MIYNLDNAQKLRLKKLVKYSVLQQLKKDISKSALFKLEDFPLWNVKLMKLYYKELGVRRVIIISDINRLASVSTQMGRKCMWVAHRYRHWSVD